MYERFTDRARKVMQLSNQEAQRFNHEYIDTEHILLGIVKEGTGLGAIVLKNFDVDLRKIRLEVEKLIVPGPDMVRMGKLPQTPRAKKAIEYAMEESSFLSHSYVGTEHLLLGLIDEEEGIAACVLKSLGVGYTKTLHEITRVLDGNARLAATKVSSGLQSYLPLFFSIQRKPPICENVLTEFGIICWNGREWIADLINPPLKITQPVEWWLPVPFIPKQ